MASSYTKWIPSTASVMALLLAAAPIVLAQSDSRPPAGPRPNNPNSSVVNPVRQPSIRERQMIMDQMLRDAAAGRPRLEEKERLALAQIAEDYSRLQMVNNRMLSENIPLAVPNFAAVIQSLEEIGKRARRLRENLHLPAKSSEEARSSYPNVADARTLKSVLLVLDERIMSFIENPIFRKPNVIDVKQASRARADLDSIAELSKKISKDAERLQKVKPLQ